MTRICVLGSLNLDLVVRAPALPRPGETLLGGPFCTFAGGKGANQAVAASRLGGAVAMIGRVGDDIWGESLPDALAREGVDVAAVRRIPGVATGVATITVAEDGENTIVVAPGANAALVAADLDGDAEGAALTGAGWLVCQLETPLPAVAHALARAKAHGARTLLNAAPAMELTDDLLGSVDVLVVNRGEAGLLGGRSSDSDPMTLVEPLRARACGTAVVTLGGGGAIAVSGPETVRQMAFRVKVVDAVGAGDAFVGGLVVALAEDQPLAAALRFACAAGALAATHDGAQPSLPRREAVASLLAGSGTR